MLGLVLGVRPPFSRVEFLLLEFFGWQPTLEQNALSRYIDMVLFLFLLERMDFLFPVYLWYALPCYALWVNSFQKLRGWHQILGLFFHQHIKAMLSEKCLANGKVDYCP